MDLKAAREILGRLGDQDCRVFLASWAALDLMDLTAPLAQLVIMVLRDSQELMVLKARWGSEEKWAKLVQLDPLACKARKVRRVL